MGRLQDLRPQTNEHRDCDREIRSCERFRRSQRVRTDYQASGVRCNPMNGYADCPQPSRLCRKLPGMVDRCCTYLCRDIVECKSTPVPGSTCGYCGG